MKGKAVGVVVLGIVFLAGLTAAIRPSIATGHTGNAAITCDSVTFSYADFANAVNTVSEAVTLDGATQHSGSFSFAGPSGSHTVAIAVPADGVDHTVVASASWNTNGHEGSFRESKTVNCGEPPPTITEPPPSFLCPDGKPPEENPVDPNDNCKRPEPPVTTPTPPVVTPPVVTPPVIPPATPETTTPEETTELPEAEAPAAAKLARRAKQDQPLLPPGAVSSEKAPTLPRTT